MYKCINCARLWPSDWWLDNKSICFKCLEGLKQRKLEEIERHFATIEFTDTKPKNEELEYIFEGT